MKRIIFFIVFYLISSIAQSQIIQNVPYFYQYNNSINPGGSCQNTSIAMVLKFYGASSVYPDAISSYYGTSQAQTVSGLQYVFNSEAQYYGIPQRIKGHSNGTFAQIQNLLAAGKPVIVHGYFTGYGHVLVLVGYNGTHYIANDPAGKWSQQYGYGGYCQCNATEGRYVYYTKSAMENAIGPNGTIWYHEILNAPAPPTPPTNVDNIKPYSHIQETNPTQYKTSNFQINFVDSDNTNGSGIDKSFYAVLDWDGSEWRANNSKGFFCDNFDFAIHSDWSVGLGSWNISNNVLVQSNTTETNTAISAHLNQGLSNRYLYHFFGKIDGSATNHGAGIHIFSDNTSLPNRGNNYLIFFRPLASKIQLMKVQNDNISIIHEFQNVSFVNNKWYDYKIMYDRTTGKITVWRDDVLIGSFTDNQPISNGVGFSFRTRECNFSVNNLKVYRTRSNSVTVSVGANSNADVRYQSPGTGLSDYSCKIKSLTVDNAGNISDIANLDLLIDWSAPVFNGPVNDGLGADITYTTSSTQVSANFSGANDPQSGIKQYEYAIGTSPGLTNIVNWTPCGTNTSFTKTGLNLQHNQTYYVSVRALNHAGLYSSAITSNGQTYINRFDVNKSLNICSGETVSIGNNIYSQTGNYVDTLTSVVYGIDSIVNLQLTVNPTYTVNNVQNLCSGDSYSVGNNSYTISGTYYDTLATINGCDSVVVSQLNFSVCTGVQNVSKIHTAIAPNPFSGSIVINSGRNIVRVEIYSLTGQVVYTQNLSSYSTFINLSHLQNGSYFIKIFFEDNGTLIQSLVKTG